MKVILTENVEDLGKKMQIVDVKQGFANNFLFKKNLALPATKENIKKLEKELAEIAANEAELKALAEKNKELLDGYTMTMKVKSGPEGRLYGAVTTQEIADMLYTQKNINIDKRKIICDTIKDLGTYDIRIKLHQQVEAVIKLEVERE
ncbi:MAG: 50S ribosomal protein L9 [Eubacteriaceae bacterium]|nr:50S ribosomal protein L9 [Eubacteriaceae bacterium]